MNFFEYISLHSRPSIAAAPFGLDAARSLRRKGSHRSYQVDELVTRYGRAWQSLIELLARALFLGSTAAETMRPGT